MVKEKLRNISQKVERTLAEMGDAMAPAITGDVGEIRKVDPDKEPVRISISNVSGVQR